MKRHVLALAFGFLFGTAAMAASPNGEKKAAEPVIGVRPPSPPATVATADPSLVAEVSRLVEASLEALRDRRDHRHKSFLKESLAKLPEFAPARWHSGYVRFDGAWVHVDQVPYLAGDNAVLAKYAELREKADASHYPKATTAEYTGQRLLDRKVNVEKHSETIPASQTAQVSVGGVKRSISVPRRFVLRSELREQLDTYAQERLRLINSAGYSPGYARAQESLARWCSENGLPEEARVHWAQVLAEEPSNESAASQLGLVKFGDKFIRKEQLNRARHLASDAARSRETWHATLTRLRHQAASAQKPIREGALAELGKIDDPNAVHSLEQVCQESRSTRQGDNFTAFDREVVGVIGKFDSQAATESLVRFAIGHSQESVRLAAAEHLKGRELRSFVPLLLDALTMPIEYEVKLLDNALGQKQLLAAASQEHSNHIAGLREARQIYNGKHLRQLTTIAEARRQQYEAFNRRAVQLNNRIAAALVRAVDIDRKGPFRDLVFSAELNAASPQRWWEWWYDYNEQYVSTDKPYYGYDYGAIVFDDYQRSYQEYVQPMSCFAKARPFGRFPDPNRSRLSRSAIGCFLNTPRLGS